MQKIAKRKQAKVKTAGTGRRHSIRRRLMWLSLGSVLLSTLPVAGLFVAHEASRQAEARWTVMTSAAEVLASSAVEAVQTHDQSHAFAAIRAVSRTPGIIYGRVEGANHAVLAETGTGARLKNDVRVSTDFPSPGILPLLMTRSIEVEAPVRSGNRAIGRVIVVHTAEGLAGSLTQALAGMLGIAAVTLLIALMVTRRLQATMTRPLRELSESMAAISQGDFSRRVEVAGRDELGSLVDGYNAMLDAIRERDEKIAEQMRGLEAEVAARTRDYVMARDEAVAANAAKSDFLATMSHEIRTPMNGVMVMAEMLAGESLPAKARRYAATIVKSGKGLLAVINDILDFSKIEAGKLEIETTEVDIVDTVDDTLALFSAAARDKGLELVAAVSPDAPRIVLSDPVRLGQVVSNLVSNALKFTEAGHVRVRIEADAKPGFVRLVVEDTGIGIAKDKIGKLFSAFAQEDQTTTRRFGGTGLGLSIAKRLAEAMGGRIAVSSEQGVGTEFHVRLPVAGADTAAPPKVENALPVQVLVAAPVERNALALRLSAAGADVAGAAPRLTIADRTCRDQVACAPDTLVLLADAGDNEAEEWVLDGRAACILARPLRHRDFDRLIEAVRDGRPLAAQESAPEAQVIDIVYPRARVLVVDDGEVNREVACEALSRFGITAHTAANGQEALDILDSEVYDLVLMDGSMPVLDGFEATRQLRARGQDVPVVALTAHVVGTVAEAWREAGMDGVLHKPFTLEALGSVLHDWLAAHARQVDEVMPVEVVVEVPVPAEPGPAQAGIDMSLFDADTLKPILAGLKNGRSDFVTRVVGLYRSHAPEAVGRMAAACRSGDVAEMTSAAHALKSMSLNLGAKAVATVAGEVEKAAREDGRVVSAEVIEGIAALADRTIVELGRIVDAPAAVQAQAIKIDPDVALMAELEADIDAGRLEMLYQPIYDRLGQKVISAEALVRWARDGKPVGPAVFIPLAERTGLITKIGAFARRRVLSQAAAWGIPVATNVSPIELDRPGFLDGIRALLTETGYDAKCLILEVTETAFLGEPSRTRLLFEELRSLGIRLSLDDFGVGYSSLTALHRFPFDKIKIDREFVTALDGESRSALEALAIVQAVTGIGRAFGMQVVAEGIETATQHQHLKAAGIHGMQGYLFSKPVTAAELTALIGGGTQAQTRGAA
jgi:signal transduction histidine kinase/EAL domain-containing protein (putative c-di-GMP-specific phosphodiesterase class I)/CheY-like chemotaxis protein